MKTDAGGKGKMTDFTRGKVFPTRAKRGEAKKAGEIKVSAFHEKGKTLYLSVSIFVSLYGEIYQQFYSPENPSVVIKRRTGCDRTLCLKAVCAYYSCDGLMLQ